jgi:sirohydrochlorin ferrochelatase
MSAVSALLLAALAAAPSFAADAAKPDYGILLLAHGGDAAWDAEVAALTARVNAVVPTEAALGMADPATLQAGLDKLAARGVSRAIAVPLFVHSRSEVLDQTRYVLGFSEKPSEVLRAAAERMMSAHGGAHAMAGLHHHMFSLARVKTSLPVSLTPALDDDPFVSRILLARARALSRDAKIETAVLVAHGPVDDSAVAAWNEALSAHAEFVRREGGFRAATFAILRDDAPPEVRAAAVASLRARVAQGAKGGRALVVPVLIARGGIEGKLAADLKGLDYAWDGKTLMPDEGFAGWVLKRAAHATELPR